MADPPRLQCYIQYQKKPENLHPSTRQDSKTIKINLEKSFVFVFHREDIKESTL